MNAEDIKKYESSRKFREYEMKITKMAGHLSDYYIDRAIESEDFSIISGFLISHFSGNAGKSFDVGYLVSKFREFGLKDKIEDMDFDINEWYKVKYENDNPALMSDSEITIKMDEDEYLQYMIDKRKKELE